MGCIGMRGCLGEGGGQKNQIKFGPIDDLRCAEAGAFRAKTPRTSNASKELDTIVGVGAQQPRKEQLNCDNFLGFFNVPCMHYKL